MAEVPAIFGNDLQADLAQWSFVSHEILEGWQIFPAEKSWQTTSCPQKKQSNVSEEYGVLSLRHFRKQFCSVCHLISLNKTPCNYRRFYSK